MRQTNEASGTFFSYLDLDARIPAGHPLRKVRQIVNEALASPDAELAALDTMERRPSITPGRLIRAGLLQRLFSIRSERSLMEQMDCNLPFRWFVGLRVWRWSPPISWTVMGSGLPALQRRPFRS